MTAEVEMLEMVQVAVGALTPDPANPRRISESELRSLERSLREYGFVQPLLARRADGVVIGGHQRLLGRSSSRTQDRAGDLPRP